MATEFERLEAVDIEGPSFLFDLIAAHFSEALAGLGWPVVAM